MSGKDCISTSARATITMACGYDWQQTKTIQESVGSETGSNEKIRLVIEKNGQFTTFVLHLQSATSTLLGRANAPKNNVLPKREKWKRADNFFYKAGLMIKQFSNSICSSLLYSSDNKRTEKASARTKCRTEIQVKSSIKFKDVNATQKSTKFDTCGLKTERQNGLAE